MLHSSQWKVQPRKDLTLPLSNKHKAGQIFKSGNKVYKFFDNNIKCFQPNTLVQKVFSEATLQYLQHEKYCYLSYDLQAGADPHEEYKHQQFSMLCKQLSAIYDLNFVHSDIGKNNLVFSESSAEAWIIDYDHADHECVPYPPGFNHSGSIYLGITWFITGRHWSHRSHL